MRRFLRIRRAPRTQKKFQFSLRTLLLFTLLIASAAMFWKNKEPWRVEKEFYLRRGPVYSKSFSADGRYVMASGAENGIRLWDIRTGESAGILQASKGEVRAEFSPNGKSIVSGCADGTVQTWDVRSGKLLYTMPGHAGGILAVHYSSDGNLIASASQDRTARLWNSEDGTLRAILPGHSYHVWDAIFSGEEEVYTLSDRLISWDTKTGAETGRGWSHPTMDEMRTCEFVEWNGEPFRPQWDCLSGNKAVRKSPIKKYEISPDRSRVLTSQNNTIIVWRRQRDDTLGIASLPEFWLTVVFGIALSWSIVRDVRELKRPAEPGAI